ncbi:hypothetical protein KX61_003577 [Salmonella enterica subsp. enterica]|nr:hypothetical protein [Salmonella enterica subsp. enterica]
MNVACDGPSGRGPWMGRVTRSQYISNLKYDGYIIIISKILLLPSQIYPQCLRHA